MAKRFTIAVLCVGLLTAGACAPTGSVGDAATVNDNAAQKKGPGRSGDWRGNASSFPYQR